MAKRAKGSPRVGRAIKESGYTADGNTKVQTTPYPYGTRGGKLGATSGGSGRRKHILMGTDKDDEVRDPNDWRGKIGTGPHPHPRGFKKGGSVKSHGSGLARRKRR